MRNDSLTANGADGAGWQFWTRGCIPLYMWCILIYMNTEITTSTRTNTVGHVTRFEIIEGGEQIAFLDAHTATGLILNVVVIPARQGEGLARQLFEHGDDTLGLYHVPAWGRTPEGDAFAEAMGGYTMDDEEAGTLLGLTYDEELDMWVA